MSDKESVDRPSDPRPAGRAVEPVRLRGSARLGCRSSFALRSGPLGAVFYNEQPWSYIVATRESREEFQKLSSCLVEANRVWATAAPVLALGIVRLRFRTQRRGPTERPSTTLVLQRGIFSWRRRHVGCAFIR